MYTAMDDIIVYLQLITIMQYVMNESSDIFIRPMIQINYLEKSIKPPHNMQNRLAEGSTKFVGLILSITTS